jgi:hypothetical protein
LTLTSQDRHWKEIQQTFKAEVIAPLQCETNPQDEQDPKVYPPPEAPWTCSEQKTTQQEING